MRSKYFFSFYLTQADLSRFGRNYVDVGDYIDHIFPMLGVRFIAIGDNVDIKYGSTMELEASVMNLVNTYYVYDASMKVRSTIKNKWERGMLINKFTPMGYTCESKEGCWEIEPLGAAIVERIFGLALQGIKDSEIARILNDEGTPTAGQLSPRTTHTVKEEFIEWDGGMVRRILKNETYTGVLIQGQKQKLIPGKKIRVASSEVYRREGHHPALVSHEDWEKVQTESRQSAKQITKSTGSDWFLKGKVRCGVCNRSLFRKNNGMICCNRRGCENRIHEDELNAIVYEQIQDRRQALQAVTFETVDASLQEARIKELKKELAKAYEQYANGEITVEGFKERQTAIRAESDSLKTVVNEAEAHKRAADEAMICNRWFLDQSKGEFDKEMVKELIEKVLVGEQIAVVWKEN